jgi:hypothetical protein
MSYSDFTLVKFKQQFQMQSASLNLFGNLSDFPVIEPSTRLIEDIEDAKTTPTVTEKAKSELLITPVLKEMKRRNKEFNFFSGFSFHVDSSCGLTGIPDFILARGNQNLIEIESPVFCMVEAKNGVVEEGIGQCAAEMYAARLFNQQTGKPYEIIYGTVTNAFDWVFLKLENDTIYIDQERYFLNNLSRLLSVLQHIVNQYQ